VVKAKEELRRALRGVRDSIAPDRAQDASRAAAAHLLGLPVVARARTVALYAPVRRELDPSPAAVALSGRGVRLVYPRVLRGERRLAFHRMGAVSELAPGAFGILEPPASAELVDVDAIDLFVVPGLAFDATGTRLGWGRGYYDRTLAGHGRAVRIGYCFACQVLDHVPRGPDDLSMHYLVTEEGVRIASSEPDACDGPG
jgi:5-formyltetrahydrofolate cyclo-ligase